MKWKIRFYINVPEIVPYISRIEIGNFRDSPIFPFIERHKGWFFDIYSDYGNDELEAAESTMAEIETILDKLSIQLFFEISITEIIVFNVHQIFRLISSNLTPLTDEEIKSLKIIPQDNSLQQKLVRYPHGLKNQRGMWYRSEYTINVIRSIHPRVTDAVMNPIDARALKWFVKGIGAINDIDRFFAFYTSVELLSREIRLDKIHPTCHKCGKEIAHGNNCDHEILINPERMEYLKKLGLKEKIAKEIKNLRDSLTHGGKDITNSELDDLIEANIELTFFLTKQFKIILKIPDGQAPILDPRIIQIKKMGEIRQREITTEILEEIQKNIH